MRLAATGFRAGSPIGTWQAADACSGWTGLVREWNSLIALRRAALG